MAGTALAATTDRQALFWAALATFVATLAFASFVVFDRHALVGADSASLLVRIGLFQLDWLVMCLAMMTPAALSMIVAVEKLGQRSRTAGLPALTWLGFLTVWSAFGLALFAFAVMLGTLPSASLWIVIYWRAILGWLILFAGLYQISPLAMQCAKGCRSPQSFIATHWSGRRAAHRDAWTIGLHFGISCVGCCWPQMVLLSLLGLHSPGWMLLATATMAAQKSNLIGNATQYALAVTLVVCGIAVWTGLLDFQLHGAIWQAISHWCGQ